MTLDEVKSFFKGDVYATDVTGIEILESESRYAKCALKTDKRHYNAAGQVMGGVLFTLADFTFAVASNGQSDTLTVTTSSQISFLNAFAGNMLIAETELLKDGKRNCFYRINITDESGKLVATVSTTGTHLEKKR